MKIRTLIFFAVILLISACNPVEGADPIATSVVYTPPAAFEALGATRTNIPESTQHAAETPEETSLPDEGSQATSPSVPTATPNSTFPTATLAPSDTPAIDPNSAGAVTLIFTGSIVPGRCVQQGVEDRGNADYIYEDVRDLLMEADIAVGTLNAAISDHPPTTGCVETFVLVGSSEHADAMANAGIDVMSVATNHIKNCGLTDCGDIAFLDTLDNINRVGILPVGAGLNLEEASQPVVYEVRGIKFVFVSLGEIEVLAFAGENSPGIGILTEASLRERIAQAKEMGDVVIFMPHWGPEYSPIPNQSQNFYARIAVEAGADLVIGNHTHVIQGFEMINGVPVFYGLGNFVFDQNWSRETQQGIMVRIVFNGTTYAQHDIIPVHIEQDGEVFVADQQEAVEILLRIQEINSDLR